MECMGEPYDRECQSMKQRAWSWTISSKMYSVDILLCYIPHLEISKNRGILESSKAKSYRTYPGGVSCNRLPHFCVFLYIYFNRVCN
jgi:hypothetical protein